MTKTQTPQYVYKVQPTRPEMPLDPTPEEAQIVTDHFEYLKALKEQGVVMLAGRTLNDDPNGFGIVIFMADSDEEAQMIMEEDPAVKNGVMQAELFPYRIALWGNMDL